jgi:hypothetical protein
MVERARSVQHRLREFQGQLRRMLPLVEGLIETGEVREPEASYTAGQEDSTVGPSDSRYRIGPYGRRSHALYDGNELVAVTAYKRGAVEVKRRFEALEQEIARLRQVLLENTEDPPEREPQTGAVARLEAERETGSERRR